MRTLVQFLEDKKKDTLSDEERTTARGNVKFTIWKSPDTKVKWLDDNEDYLKIEYKFEDTEKNISIDFLLGFKDGSWRLWVGQIGSCSYIDDPYCDFNTDKFAEAIVMALDKVEEVLENILEDPENYVQYYKDK